MRISEDVGYGSHLPALRWAVEKTNGPIFEMGAGLYSTSYLFRTGRWLTTYELDPAWESKIKDKIGYSRKHLWINDMPLAHYSVALIDGGRDESWLTDRREMFDVIDADIILVHDMAPHLFCEDWRPWYGADKRFKYQAWYTPVGYPATWITSDSPIEGLPEEAT